MIMKHLNTLVWLMAIVITSITMIACNSNEDIETNKSTDINSMDSSKFYASGVALSGTRSATDHPDVLFTEQDIEWFNVTTREIRFKNMEEPLYKRMLPYREIEFHLGDDALFVVSSFVALWDSRVFDNLVLCYGNTEKDVPNIDGSYYLYDCYPPQNFEKDEVKANREKNATQWAIFTKYLKEKGKLKE